MSPTDKIDNLIKQLKTTASGELDRRIDALIEQPSKQPTLPMNTWSRIMKSNITKSAAAAMIIIAVLTGIYQLTGSIDGASIALADVAKRIEQMQNCVFEKTTTVSSKENDKKPHNSLLYITESFLREDIYKDNEEVTSQVYVNYLEGIIIGIDHQMMLFAEKKLTGDDIELGAVMSPENIVSSILSKGDYKKLGRKIVDGVLSDGFEFDDKRTLLSMDKAKTQKITVRLWVDVTTHLPVRVEADALYNNVKVNVVQNNPKWDIELEADFFEPTIPANYITPEERGLIGVNLENWPRLKVQPGMAAAKAGIKDGDVVLMLDGKSIDHIKSSNEAQKRLLGKSGEKVSFTVKRGDEVMTIDVIRDPLPLE
jgi:hypothetical protein